MSNLINIDDYLQIEQVVRRDLGTDKFIVSGINEDGNIFSYINPSIEFADLLMIIDILVERKNIMFGE